MDNENAATVTKEMSFKFCLILINLSLNIHRDSTYCIRWHTSTFICKLSSTLQQKTESLIMASFLPIYFLINGSKVEARYVETPTLLLVK